MNQYILAVSLLLLAVAANATEDVCSSDYFNCNQHNPCKQLCVPGQMNYHGLSRKLYVTCDNNGGCTSNTCENEEFFNRFEHKCLAWGSSSSSNQSIDGRCQTDKYNCQENNPCIEPTCTDSLTYPGYWRNQYVQCGAQGKCHEKKCEMGHVYDDITAECVLKEEESKHEEENDMDKWEEISLNELLPNCQTRHLFDGGFNSKEKKTDSFDIIKWCTLLYQVKYMIKFNFTASFGTCYEKDGFCVPISNNSWVTIKSDSDIGYEALGNLKYGEIIDTCTRNASIVVVNRFLSSYEQCFEEERGYYVYVRPADAWYACYQELPCLPPQNLSPINVYKKMT